MVGRLCGPRHEAALGERQRAEQRHGEGGEDAARRRTARAVSNCGSACRMRWPSPFSEPAHSARIAAMPANARLSFAPVMSPGSAAGASTSRNVCQRDAPNERMSLRRSASARPSASSVETTIGNRQTSATIAIFGAQVVAEPDDEQRRDDRDRDRLATSRAAGTATRRTGRQRWIATAAARPSTSAAPIPSAISRAVTVKLLHSSARSSTSAAAIALGAGSRSSSTPPSADVRLPAADDGEQHEQRPHARELLERPRAQRDELRGRRAGAGAGDADVERREDAAGALGEDDDAVGEHRPPPRRRA